MITTDKWVYIHVPRTAGSTFENKVSESWNRNAVADAQHTTVYDLKGNYQNRFIFGFVRNPYTYEWSIWKSHQHWDIFENFDEWCSYRFDGNQEYFYEKFPNRKMELDYGNQLFIRDMSGYFCDENKQSYVSQIYRFEELEESWKEIQKRTEIDVNLVYHQSNYQITYRDEYTDYSYDLVSRHRAQDIELFGYDFDGYTGDVPLKFTTHYVGYNYAYSRG